MKNYTESNTLTESITKTTKLEELLCRFNAEMRNYNELNNSLYSLGERLENSRSPMEVPADDSHEVMVPGVINSLEYNISQLEQANAFFVRNLNHLNRIV